MICENIEKVQARITAACNRAGHDRENVTLIAVSKTKPIADLEKAYRLVCGISEKIKCRS